jgi:adenylate cyclase
MATATATRHLAAILAADVAGYSRLMETDEEGTLERLKAHLSKVVDPNIREHHGRSKSPFSPACARPGCRRSDRTRPKCDFSYRLRPAHALAEAQYRHVVS